MGDGAKEITKAGEEVFDMVGTRLMCWPHTYRNLVTRMSALRRENKTLCQEHTFKRRCPLGTFMNLINRMVNSLNNILVLTLFWFRWRNGEKRMIACYLDLGLTSYRRCVYHSSVASIVPCFQNIFHIAHTLKITWTFKCRFN